MIIILIEYRHHKIINYKSIITLQNKCHLNKHPVSRDPRLLPGVIKCPGKVANYVTLYTHSHFEVSRVNLNRICTAGLQFYFEGSRVSRDQEFEKSRVNLLSYIGKKFGTGDSLRAIKNFERSKFEPSRVTCKYRFSFSWFNQRHVFGSICSCWPW